MARGSSGGTAKWIGIVLIVLGAIMVVAGAVTYATVSSKLAEQKITVADDAACMAGRSVTGPIEAFCQADIIDHHAMEATGGKTYAELDREDPLRQTAMTASFLQASLFTSVVAFGVAIMAVGIGIGFVLVGIGLMSVARHEL